MNPQPPTTIRLDAHDLATASALASELATSRSQVLAEAIRRGLPRLDFSDQPHPHPTTLRLDGHTRALVHLLAETHGTSQARVLQGAIRAGMAILLEPQP